MEVDVWIFYTGSALLGSVLLESKIENEVVVTVDSQVTISVWNTLPHVSLIVTNITTFRSMLHPLLAIMCPYPTLHFICIFSHGVHTLISCILGSYYGYRYVLFAFLQKNCYREKKISVGKNFHVD